MSKRTRILLGIVAVYIGAVGFLLYRISLDIDPRYRESAEESLVDIEADPVQQESDRADVDGDDAEQDAGAF